MTTRREKIAAQDVILAAVKAALDREEMSKGTGRDGIANAIRAELDRLSKKYGAS